MIAQRGHAEAPTTKVASVQEVSGEIAQKISTNVVDAYSQSCATRATDLCGCVFGFFLRGEFSGEHTINRRVSGALDDAGCAEALPHLFRKSDSSIAIFECSHLYGEELQLFDPRCRGGLDRLRGRRFNSLRRSLDGLRGDLTAFFGGAITVNRTFVTPTPSRSISRAAACERSMMRPLTNGPRS